MSPIQHTPVTASMKDDFTTHDGLILLTANRHKGIWATETRLKSGRRTRTAGQISTSASAHSLLVIGLTAALKSISGRDIRKISRYRERKARLRVISNDATFSTALQALMKNDEAVIANVPLRAGKQFLRMLAKQLARFDIELMTDLEDRSYSFQALKDWVQVHVRSPREQELLPAFMLPVVVSES